MPTFPDYGNFAFSFSHATVMVNGSIYTAIRNIRLSQRLQESAVYGTARAPLGRSAGQLEMGQGTLIFSDLNEAFTMFGDMAPDPFFKTFSIDYVLVNEALQARTVELKGCRFIGLDIDHEAGPESLPAEFPFSFLSMSVDGNALVLGVASLLSGITKVVSLFK